MDTLINPVPSKVRSVFQEECDRMSGSPETRLVLSHFGTFSLRFINGLTERVEDFMVSAGDDKLDIKRMFTLLIEGVNNIRKHGRTDLTGEQLGFLLLCKVNEYYEISMANLVDRSQSESLVSFIEKVNTFSVQELPLKFEAALDNEFISHEGGAGMGFVVTRIKTGDLLHHRVVHLSEELDLFVFTSRLPRTMSK